ncbi:hypothetical protein ACFYOK_10125 [Microbispora bryophytorum]|uniref:hypothetical protein n=1 Tax=Microbispora bryophytorum TaxID=1460882 RepID=UPI003411B4FF
MTDRNPGWERRTLAMYAFWLAMVVSFAGGVFLTLLDKRLSMTSALSAIGLNLVASVVFALVFSWLSGNIQQRILLESVQDEHRLALQEQQAIAEKMSVRVEDVSRQLFDKLAGYETQYMPAASYDASSDLNSEFNKDVSQSLAVTSNYAFRGTSAKFVPVRLKKTPRGNLREVKIVMLDPRSDNVIRARAAERIEQHSFSGKSVEAVAAKIRDEILMSIVALFDHRYICPMNIALVQETAVTRLEVFDDALYVSWYRGPNSTKVPFPETFKFRRGSFLYDVYAQEIYRRYDIADHTFQLWQKTTEEQLSKFLAELVGSPVGEGELTRWRNDYAAFAEPVERFLDSTPAGGR